MIRRATPMRHRNINDWESHINLLQEDLLGITPTLKFAVGGGAESKSNLFGIQSDIRSDASKNQIQCTFGDYQKRAVARKISRPNTANKASFNS